MDFYLEHEDPKEMTKVLALAQYLLLPDLEELILGKLAKTNPDALKRCVNALSKYMAASRFPTEKAVLSCLRLMHVFE